MHKHMLANICFSENNRFHHVLIHHWGTSHSSGVVASLSHGVTQRRKERHKQELLGAVVLRVWTSQQAGSGRKGLKVLRRHRQGRGTTMDLPLSPLQGDLGKRWPYKESVLSNLGSRDPHMLHPRAWGWRVKKWRQQERDKWLTEAAVTPKSAGAGRSGGLLELPLPKGELWSPAVEVLALVSK